MRISSIVKCFISAAFGGSGVEISCGKIRGHAPLDKTDLIYYIRNAFE